MKKQTKTSKREYRSPRLTHLGTVRQLTHDQNGKKGSQIKWKQQY